MNAYWQFKDGGTVYHGRHMSDDAKKVARPVVVIDPEDAVQVVRLVALFWANGNEDLDDPAAMTLALREFASPTPVKPPEPTSLGAVAEDTDGNPWVRADVEPGNAWVFGTSGWRRWRTWDEINVARIVSYGQQS